MKTAIITLSGIIAFVVAPQASEFHVAVNGNDLHAGTKAAPLGTIQRAAISRRRVTSLPFTKAFTASESTRHAEASPSRSVSSIKPPQARRSRSSGSEVVKELGEGSGLMSGK